MKDITHLCHRDIPLVIGNRAVVSVNCDGCWGWTRWWR